MSGKVIHLSKEVHSRMMEFCQKNDIPASRWVERLIYTAISKETSSIQAVEHKSFPKEQMSDNMDDPWTKPPFWERNE